MHPVSGRRSRRPDRRRVYFWLMGTCVVLILLAWNLVRLWSVPVAVGMSVVAALIPPAAAIVGNWGAERDLDLPRDQPRPGRERQGPAEGGWGQDRHD